MPRSLSTATLRSSSGVISIDVEAGVIKGVKLMDLGKLAKFAGEDGPKQLRITDAHIAALLAHAGNRAIPIHETHEWFDAQGKANADSVEREARIGALKQFRRDDAGNLIADAYLNLQKQPAKDLIWGAEHNPEDNCFSVVFSYLKDDPQCIPQNFRAGDIVPSGAATTALFSEDTSTTPSMDINELIEALKDEKVQAAVSAIIKSHKADSTSDDTASAEMESDAGVGDGDKKADDDQKPALMRACLRVGRAFKRQIAEAKANAIDKTALLAEAKTVAQAETTALLGKSGFIGHSGADGTTDTYTATLAKYQKDEPNGQKALAKMLRENPDLYPVHEQRTRLRVASFKAA